MADGPTPPKGWLLTGVIFLVLSLAGCGAGAFGCASFVNDLQKSVDQGGETPLGTETTFTATGSMGAILTTDPTSTTCEGTDGSGSTMSFSSPGSGTTGNVQTDGRDFDLAFTFDVVEVHQRRVEVAQVIIIGFDQFSQVEPCAREVGATANTNRADDVGGVTSSNLGAEDAVCLVVVHDFQHEFNFILGSVEFINNGFLCFDLRSIGTCTQADEPADFHTILCTGSHAQNQCQDDYEQKR